MTDGKKSSFPLTRLAAKYNEMQNNGRYLSNKNAMQIIWMRIQELAKRIDLNHAPERMSTIQKMWKSYREKLDSKNDLEAGLIAIKIDAEFEAAYHDYASWQQMFQALELHSKMTESEVKILKDMRALMTAEDAYELTAKVMAVMLKVLKDDPRKLREAQFELAALVGDNIDRRFGGSSRQSGSETGSDNLDREQLLYPGDEERSDPSGEIEVSWIPQGRDPGSAESG